MKRGFGILYFRW